MNWPTCHRCHQQVPACGPHCCLGDYAPGAYGPLTTSENDATLPNESGRLRPKTGSHPEHRATGDTT